MEGLPQGALAISGWVVAEVSSALALKVRAGQLDLGTRARADDTWRELRQESLVELAVPPEAWELAAQFARQHQLGLRAGDALHLAVASLGNHSVATLDLGMRSAALELGIVVEKIRGT